MRYLSLFSGYGGFELGIQQAYGDYLRGGDGETEKWNGESDSPIKGMEAAETDTQRPGDTSSVISTGITRSQLCIGFSEIDKYAIQTYQKHFPYKQCELCRLRCLQQNDSERPEERNNASDKLSERQLPTNCQCKHKQYGDITTINPADLPDFDLLVGGFPCQAFSIAGKRLGFADTRGTLFFDIARILKEKQPRLVLLENVKGLLSHDNGRTFKTIITSLAELGYAVEWQVLNAKNFGVPQNRERVFIIGHLGGFGGRQVFPIGASDTVNPQSYGQGNETAYCLQAGGDKHRGSYITHTNRSGNTTKRDTAASLRAGASYNYQTVNRIRRLTPTECERLMGLPDGWTEGVSDTQRYKLCGNGVVINVVEEIIKRLFNGRD